MIGLDRQTGGALGGDAHLAQSLTDLLTTPKGSRVMRREYGVDLGALIDAPITPSTAVDFFMAVAEAVARWEPRLQLTGVRVLATEAGRAEIALEGRIDGRDTATGVVIGGAT